MANNLIPVDRERIQELRSLFPEHAEFSCLYSDFLEEMPVRLDALHQAIHAGAEKETEELAHGLRGSGASLGARHLTRAAAALENRARQGRLQGAGCNLLTVAVEVERLRGFLENEGLIPARSEAA